MNNLEWLKKKKCKKYDNVTYAFCKVLYEIENSESCYNKRTCDSCKFKCDSCKFKTFGAILQYLSEEHKEPIKLKQWEYDLMYGLEDSRFYDWDYLCYMKEKGYFKGITNMSMEIEDILKNCEIVSDDYEGFEECK